MIQSLNVLNILQIILIRSARKKNRYDLLQFQKNDLE